MKHRREEAYVLGTHDLGEADVIVTLLAESAGKIRGVATSARKSRKRFGGTLEPMTRVRASWTEREGRELHRIETLELERSYAAMQSEPERQAACAVLCDVAAAVGREGQAESDAFRLTGAVLDALEAGLDPWTAVRYFEFWILRLHGVLPDLAACGRCGAPLEGSDPAWAAPPEGLACRACAAPLEGARRLAPADRAALVRFSSTPPSKVGDSAPACRPGGALERLLRGSLEAFVERPLRTYRHLRALAP